MADGRAEVRIGARNELIAGGIVEVPTQLNSELRGLTVEIVIDAHGDGAEIVISSAGAVGRDHVEAAEELPVIGDEDAAADDTIATLGGAGANEIMVVIVQ